MSRAQSLGLFVWVDRRLGLSTSILPWFGLAPTATGCEVSVPRAARALGWLITVLVLSGSAALFIISAINFPLISPWATVDEQLLYYQTARNFNTYGFLNSLFLHDLSTSSNAAHHPFVYSHMPPGPDILVALLERGLGGSYLSIRLVFAAVFATGVVVYLRFAGRLLEGLGGPRVAFLPLLFLVPATLLHTVDHPAFSPFLLLAFAPPLLIDRYAREGGAVRAIAAGTMVLIASMYLIYQHLIVLLLAWSLFVWAGVIRARRRHLVAMGLIAVAGVAAHAVQNLVYFGIDAFATAVWMTVSNRMFGVPDHEQLAAFYRTIDAVHHGRHDFNPVRVLGAFHRTMNFAGRGLVILLGLLVVVTALIRHPWTATPFDPATLTIRIHGLNDRLREFVPLGRVLGAVMVALLVPIALTPAYSSDYGLQGINTYYLALVAAGVLSLALRYAGSLFTFAGPPSSRPFTLALAGVLALALVGVGAVRVADVVKGLAREARIALRPHPYASLVELERHIGGHVVMTNVYSVVAGFFAREASFGACEDTAFPVDGPVDPRACFTAYIRGYARGAEVRPTHYVLFRDLLTGFTVCRDRCLDMLYRRVLSRHEVVFENDLYTVFRLKGPVVGSGAEYRMRLASPHETSSAGRAMTGIKVAPDTPERGMIAAMSSRQSAPDVRTASGRTGTPVGLATTWWRVPLRVRSDSAGLRGGPVS